MIKITRTYSPTTHNTFRGRLNPSSRNMQVAIHVPYGTKEMPQDLEPVLAQLVTEGTTGKEPPTSFEKYNNLMNLVYLRPERAKMLDRKKAWDSLRYSYNLSFRRGRFKHRSDDVRARLFC